MEALSPQLFLEKIQCAVSHLHTEKAVLCDRVERILVAFLHLYLQPQVNR